MRWKGSSKLQHPKWSSFTYAANALHLGCCNIYVPAYILLYTCTVKLSCTNQHSQANQMWLQLNEYGTGLRVCVCVCVRAHMYEALRANCIDNLSPVGLYVQNLQSLTHNHTLYVYIHDANTRRVAIKQHC